MPVSHLILAVALLQSAPGDRKPGAERVVVEQSVDPAALPPEVVEVQARRVLVARGGVLLPEGTWLIRARGRLMQREGIPRFLAEEFADDPSRAIELAPGPAADDVAGLIAGLAESDSVPVDLTGEILVFRARNFLLPELVTRLDGSMPRSEPPIAEASTAAGEPVPVREESAPAIEAESPLGAAETIEASLRARVGPVARSADPRLSEVVSPAGIAMPMPADLAVAGEPREQPLVRRRGTVIRDEATGGWRFVPVSQDGGTPDASLRILPSRALESLAPLVRAAEGPLPLLVSGRLIRSGGESWLRLIAFEQPRGGQGLWPGR